MDDVWATLLNWFIDNTKSYPFFILLLSFLDFGFLYLFVTTPEVRKNKLLSVFIWLYTACMCFIILYWAYTHSTDYLSRTPDLPKLDASAHYYDSLLNLQKLGKNVEKEKDSTFKVITGIVGEDTKGRKAVFNIGILTSDFYWKLGDTTLDGINNNHSSFSFKKHILSSNFLKRIKESKGVICIGNASYERGDEMLLVRLKHEEDELEKLKMSQINLHSQSLKKLIKDLTWDVENIRQLLARTDEQNRAGQRALLMAENINELLDTSISVYMVNLGFSLDQNPLHSNTQRSVVIILIQKYEANVNIQEAVYRAILDLNGMPFRIIDFSLGKKEKFEVIKKFD
jgi:hypothetical protein